MADPIITTIAGYGSDPSGFGGPAAGLDLRQATPGTKELGRNQGVAVDSQGRVLIAATATNVVGRIEPPQTWSMQSLGELLTSPTGALPWTFYSPSSATAATFEAAEYQGRSAVHWVATNPDARTVLYLQPTIVGGADGRCSVWVVGRGTVVLNLYNGGAETVSRTVTLSDTPQQLVAEKVFSPTWVQFKIRSAVAQQRLEVTAFDASIEQSQVTGDTAAVAGRTSRMGYDGDGGPATAALLNAPTALAVDRHGDVIIADTYNNRIRRVDDHGRITTIAGTGRPGSDHGTRADRSDLDHPSGVAVDRSGNVFVADTYNHRIRRIDPQGRIQTIAGTGTAGYGGDGGRADRALLNHPHGLAVDAAGNLLVADTFNDRIRRIDRSGRIETIAGNGVHGFGGDGGPPRRAALATPYDVEVAADGTVFVADTLNNRIRRIAGDTVDTFAGTGAYGVNGRTGGRAVAAQLAEPLAVAVDDSSGDLYVVETTQAVLRITR
jgi:sugar lactone lactonase YvrE